jgi:hypothetical protein
MARDLKQFLAPLTSSEEEPGLSPIDTRLNTITDLLEQRKFKEAADHTEKLLDEQVYDIRPISALLFQAFLEDGFRVLPDLLDACAALLGDNLAAVGPLKRREEQFNRRYAWLFEAISDALKYHQARATPEWERWRQGLTPDTIARSLEKVLTLQGLIKDSYKTAYASLGRVEEWLRGPAGALPAIAEAAPAPTPAAAAAPTPAAPPSLRSALVSMAPSSPQEPLEPVRRRVELEVSHAFIELWAKLRAFEALVEKGKMDRAALVADDIQHLLENFDPRDYFPELFGSFSKLVSKNINPLLSYSENRGSDHWKAMSQFYRVDLKGFVDSLDGSTPHACRARLRGPDHPGVPALRPALAPQAAAGPGATRGATCCSRAPPGAPRPPSSRPWSSSAPGGAPLS